MPTRGVFHCVGTDDGRRRNAALHVSRLPFLHSNCVESCEIFSQSTEVSDPKTIDQWLALARQHEIVAHAVIEDRVAASQGYFHCAMAIEASLKALILSLERPNDVSAWLASVKTHDLRVLSKRAKIEMNPGSPLAPALFVALQWDREQGYDPRPMPRKVARAMQMATFGEKGIVTWIRSVLRTSS